MIAQRTLRVAFAVSRLWTSEPTSPAKTALERWSVGQKHLILANAMHQIVNENKLTSLSAEFGSFEEKITICKRKDAILGSSQLLNTRGFQILPAAR
jgi:hypothetical protein